MLSDAQASQQSPQIYNAVSTNGGYTRIYGTYDE